MRDHLSADNVQALWDLLTDEHKVREQLIFVRPRDEILTRLRETEGVALDYDGTASEYGDHPTDLDKYMHAGWWWRKQLRRRAVSYDVDILTHDHDTRDAGWIQGNAELYGHAGVTREHIALAAIESRLRAGARELLEHYPHRVVVSMGIADIIEAALHHHGVTNCHVAATRLQFHEDGRVKGRHPDHVIVISSRKGIELQNFCASVGIHPSRCLVVGDSYGDRELFWIGGVRVFVIPTDQHGNLHLPSIRRQALVALLPHIDVIVTDTLRPLHRLVREAQPR